MTADVISHSSAPRKRRGWTAYIARRLLALTLTLAVLGAASWFGPQLRPAPQPADLAEAPTAAPAEPMTLEEVDIALDLKNPTPPPARASNRRHRPVALTAAAAPIGEDYEILSSAELDRISQARD